MLHRYLIPVLAFGCGKSDDVPGHASAMVAPPVRSAAACTAAANELGTFLRTLDHSSTFALDGMEPVVRDDLPATANLHDAPLIRITAAGDTKFHDKVMNRGELVEALASEQATIRAALATGSYPRMDPPDPHRLLLAVDRRATWQDVVITLGAAHDNAFDHIEFAFATPPQRMPPRTQTDDELDKLKPDADGNLSGVLAEYTSRKIAACPALIQAFGEVPHGEIATERLLASVGPAVIDCHCAVDPAELRSLFWRIAGVAHPMRAIGVSLDPSAKPFVVEQGTRWSDIAKGFAVDGTSVWFDLK